MNGPLVVIDAGWTGTPQVLRVTKREMEALDRPDFDRLRGGTLLPDVTAVWDGLDIVFTREPPVPCVTTLPHARDTPETLTKP